ncbi:zinc finger BED domain-containing protein 5-like [Palaemon carinicauda]|uniref:zinc finger BED domain-containing protein 5-like n=1 Tax=Palaemon carinicauda TaxID=392227 RepID=UPI0035B5D156
MKIISVISNIAGTMSAFRLAKRLIREPTDEFAQEIVHHLSLLKTELKHYFLDVTCAYVANPFSVDPADLPVETGEQEEIIDIQADETAKTKHKECFTLNFWVNMASSYSTLARHAVPQLLIFPSTWECKQGFSYFMAIKSKSRNRLAAPGHDFRCAVSKVLPHIDQLVEKKQIQPSH